MEKHELQKFIPSCSIKFNIRSYMQSKTAILSLLYSDISIGTVPFNSQSWLYVASSAKRTTEETLLPGAA